MGAPVWVLSVDLQTKTATFQSGMADAARSARGTFTEIGGGAQKMGETVGRTSGEARHGVMMLGEEFGVHLPRGLTTFIASLGPVGAAMEAAFPFIAIILGATLLLEHLNKLREAGMKLTEDQEKFKLAAQNAFNSMDDKILEAGKRVDELRGDHVDALKKELELIDHQSLEQLAKEFGVLAKAADMAFADIKSHWYTFGAGAEGAKHSLESFQLQYEALLAKKDESGASALLAAKVQRESAILAAQQDANANKGSTNLAGFQSGDHAKYQAAFNTLKQIGVGWTQNEITAQQTLVDTLKDQVTIEHQAADLKKLNATGAKLTEAKKEGKDAENARRLAEELARAEQEGVNHMGEIIRAANAQMETAIEQGEREKINATKEGSAERLAAIDASIQEEERNGMESTGFYRSLLSSRVTLARQMGEDEKKVRADAAREDAAQDERMGELAIAYEREQWALYNSGRRVSDADRLAEEVQMADEETALQMTAASQQIAALDKTGKEYENKLKQLQDRQLQMVQEHENAVTAIKDKAEIASNARVAASYARFVDTTSASLTQSIMVHQSWGKTVTSIGNQVVAGMMENAIKSVLLDDFGKERDAAKAARKGFNWGMEYGGPAAPVLAPIFAATAFAAVMAFEGGGIVPGVGRGDIVPAMLEPGEGVLPKQLMERLSTSGGSAPSGRTYNLHVSPTYNVATIDGDGMQDALDKHTDVLQNHFENVLRKLNK